jgi:hypothetical protein
MATNGVKFVEGTATQTKERRLLKKVVESWLSDEVVESRRVEEWLDK